MPARTPREVREYFVPDFSNWKDRDIYAKAFEILVRSLKADVSQGVSAPMSGRD